MRMSRRHFLAEAFRSVAVPLVNGYRLLTVLSDETGPDLVSECHLGNLSSFIPGYEKTIPPHFVVSSDERGLRARMATLAKPHYCALAIKNGNQLWAKPKDHVSETAYLCHMTLEMKEL